MQKNILKSDFSNTMFLPGFQHKNDRFCDVTEKLMKSSKIWRHFVYFMTRNIPVNFYNVTINSFEVIEGGRNPPSPSFFTFKKAQSY